MSATVQDQIYIPVDSGVLVYLVALGKPNASTAFAIHSLE